jgi:hypothetical protein
MDKEPYVKPDVKTVILELEALCYNVGSYGGSTNQDPFLFGISGGLGGLGGLGGSTGEGPSVGDGGSGVR